MRRLVLSGGQNPDHESPLTLGDLLSNAGHEVAITDGAAVLAQAAHRALTSRRRGAAGVL